MSKLNKTNVNIVRKVDVTASLISAVNSGILDKVKELIYSHGLSHCECGNGGYVPLFFAVNLGHIEIAKFLLQEGARTDCETDNVSTLLHSAAKQGCLEIVQLLLEKNATVNSQTEENETPLHFAAKEGHAEIVKVLLSNHASVTAQTNEGLPPLFFAVEGRHEEVVRMLLQHACTELNASAKPTDSTFLDRILLCNPSVCDRINELVVYILTHDEGKIGIVSELIDHGFTVTCDAKHNPLLLHTAVKNGHEELIKMFLNSGFDANAKDEKGKTCLCYSLDCCEEDKAVRIIQLLLDSGADVKEAPELLHIAVRAGLMEVCKLLIKSGADINALNKDNDTSLYLAVAKFDRHSPFYGSNSGSSIERNKEVDDSTRYNIVKLLLYGGADVNILVQGQTAFHETIHVRREELISMFLNFGVDIDILADGITPLYLACQMRNARIVEFLCKNDADLSGQKTLMPPLELALNIASGEIVDILLKYGADIGFHVSRVFRNSYKGGCDENYLSVVRIFEKHLIKIKAAGLNVSDPNSHLDDRSLFNFKRACEEEVTKLKNEKICHKFTLFDILVSGKKPSFAKNKSLMEILQSFNFDRFPIYQSLITSNLEISKFRLQLLQSGEQSLDILVKISCKLNGQECPVLPVEILEEIVLYLSYSEVRNLIYCSNLLKCQLSQF